MEKNKINLFIGKFAVVGIFSVFLYIVGCANQQPPGGGDVDKTPPKVKSVSPKPNTVNYRGNSITIDFDEYIDRRSFQDAFRISPQYKGDITYDFSGKSVEVKFDKSFDKINSNKTFVVNINSGLTDIHGNAITEPINFASTLFQPLETRNGSKERRQTERRFIFTPSAAKDSFRRRG